ncbi:MAG: PhzF family phenazine biosynthesis protein [Arenicella sp.]|jgi:PhzF family phenazine biosynthesis protein
MHPIEIYQVDAFANQVFAGNPAAICPLDEWLPDEVMQNIAKENNLAETAFVVNENGELRIRWFTPTIEVDLCGHATLAAAHVFFNHLDFAESKINFNSRSGILSVEKQKDGLLQLDFPSDSFRPSLVPTTLFQALGVGHAEVYAGRTDLLVLLGSQEQVEMLTPNMVLLAEVETRGVIVTSVGKEADFVSRFFAPQSGIDEDPVTGSAHTTLIPFWAGRLGKGKFFAQQISDRGGELWCELDGERVKIAGKAVTFLVGKIFLE